MNLKSLITVLMPVALVLGWAPVAMAAGPTATAGVANVVQADAGDNFYQFTVTYDDVDFVDYFTVNGNDNAIQVTNTTLGFSQNALFVAAFPATDSDSIVVFYEITPPGGTWNDADSGTYTISALANQVFDFNFESVPAGPITTFTATMDTTAPATPSRPDLIAADDSGESSTDNVTNVNLPTFVGTSEAGATVKVFRTPGTQLGSTTADGSGNWSFTVGAAIPDGSFAIRATATDAAGNASGVTASLVVQFDTTAPGAPGTPDMSAASDSGSSNTDNTTNATTPTFTGSATTNNRVVLTSDVDGALGNVLAAASAWSIAASSTLTEGTHQITATQQDTAGNVSVSTSALSVLIDRTAPTSPTTPDLASSDDSGASNSDDYTNETNLAFSGSRDADSVIHLYADSIFVGSDSTSASTTWNVSGGPFAEGVHTYNAEAVDVAGNTSATSTSLSVTIDTTSPAAPSTPDLASASDTGKSNTDNVFNALPATVSGTAEVAAALRVLDQATSGVLGSSTVDGSGNWSASIAALTEGQHDLVVEAEDLAGNVSSVSAALSVTYDVTAPAAPSAPDMLASDDSGVSNTDNITNQLFTVEGTAEASSDLSVESSVDGVLGTTTASAGGAWSLAIASLSEGTHTITAISTDIAGNQGVSSSSLSATYDITAPSTPNAPDLDAASDSGASDSDDLTADTTPTFIGSTEGNANVTLKTDALGDLVSDTAAAGGDWVLTASALSDGTHSMRVYAKDVAGNQSSDSNALSIRVASATPSINLSAAPSTIDEGQSATITATLDAITPEDVDVTLTLSGAASSNADSTLTSSTLSISAGQLTANTTIDALSDGLDEAQEDVVVAINSVSHANSGTTPSATILVNDTDGAVTVSVADANVVEGTGGAPTVVSLAVNLNAISGLDVTVPFTLSGTALDTTDYVVTTASPLVFTAGTTTLNINVEVAQDALAESLETVVVTLDTPTNATIAQATATLSIQDDDVALTVASITRSGVSPTNTTPVVFDVTFSSAVTGVDFADFEAFAASGSLSGAIVTDVQGSGATYAVSVETDSGDGELALHVLADGSVADANGNVLSAGATSSDNYIIDRTAPVLTLTGDSVVQVLPNDTYIDSGATASDTVDGDITSSIVVTNPVDTTAMAVYTVSYNVSDAAGNAADEVTRTVRVFNAAKSFIVDPASVSATEDGSIENPFKTMGGALAACVAGRGDSVMVRRGVFAETLTVPAFVSMTSERGAYHTHVLGTLTLADGVTMRGFSVIGDGTMTGVTIDADATVAMSNMVVARFLTGVLANVNSTVSIDNSTIALNANYGVFADAGAVIDGLKNNIFDTNGVALACEAWGLVNNGFNGFNANTTDVDGPSLAASDMLVEPGFVDATTNNFHLERVSALRDAGDPDAAYDDVDGSLNDLGADGGPYGVTDTTAPVASFTASPETGLAPVLVTVDASASNDEWGIYSYSWDFDAADGVAVDETGETSNVVFDQPGTYTITLTVEDNNGLTSDAQFDVVVTTVKTDPPVVTLAASPNAGVAPLKVKVKATASDPDGGTVKIFWDLNNDGTMDAGPTANQTVTFNQKTKPGSYPINVVAIDDENDATFATVYVTITLTSRFQSMLIDPSTDTKLVYDLRDKQFGGSFVLVPKGATSSPLVLTLGPVGSGRYLPPRAVSLGFEAGPSNMTFSKPVHVSVALKEKPKRKELIEVLKYNEKSGKWVSPKITNLTLTQGKPNMVSFDTTELGLFIVRLKGVGHDVNCDGRISAVDVQLSVNATLNRHVDYDCDVDGDGYLSANDMQDIVNAACNTRR